MQGRFAALYRDTRAEIRALAGAGLPPQEFGNHMAGLLEEAHTAAVVLGRHAAGDFAPLEADDHAFAALVMDGEAEFLAAFVRDLEAGRYAAAPAALLHRAESYAGRLAGTANEALTLASDRDALWTWALGGTEKHCPDCPLLAAGSPYRGDELPAVPGDNSTACLSSCGCVLRREDGLEGFRVPEDV